MQEIIDAENTSAWTLMHRFNKAADLISEQLSTAGEGLPDAMAAVFVWLRFSATRHLTWQRNYNTQPRILSEAQKRLVGTITQAHGQTSGEAQEWVRFYGRMLCMCLHFHSVRRTCALVFPELSYQCSELQ